eukprot:482225-Prymnesium_polylepis.1
MMLSTPCAIACRGAATTCGGCGLPRGRTACGGCGLPSRRRVASGGHGTATGVGDREETLCQRVATLVGFDSAVQRGCRCSQPWRLAVRSGCAGGRLQCSGCAGGRLHCAVVVRVAACSAL